MENLLLEILKSPTDLSIQKVEALLDTKEGIEMFIILLQKNNVISFTYMKMQVKEWLINPIRQDFILKYKNIFFNLIYECTPHNLNLLCDFFEILFFNYFYWPDFVDFLVNKEDPKSYKVLNSLFVKFRKLPKSDKLFLEIIECINKTKSLFQKYYFVSDPIEDINFLNIFYSLIYQDIHSFFEDNINNFIDTLCKLFKKKDLQLIIYEIYNLFITKYSDLLDFTKILGSVLISIDSFDFIKYSVLLNIIKKKKEDIFKFEDILINACKLGSILSDKEKDEMLSLEYSKNIINNIDVYRGIIIDLLINLSKNNNNFINKLLNNNFNEESEIFFYTALKIKNDKIIKKSKIIINNINSDIYLSFICFRYLLVIKEYCLSDIKFIKKDHPSAYLCIEMYNRYLQKINPIENIIFSNIITNNNQIINFDIDNSINSINNLINSNNYNNQINSNSKVDNPIYFNNQIINVDIDNLNNINYNILNNLKLFLINKEEDQYSFSLMNRIIKINYNLMTDDLYNFILEYTNHYIRNINSVLAFQYIFDIFGILITKGSSEDKLKYERDFSKLISLITSEEIIELYNYSFYLLSIIIKYSTNDYSQVIQIVSQDRLWTSKDLLLSLICLSISLYNRNYMSDEQINYITQYLCTVNKYYSYILSDNTNYSIRINEDIEEYFILQSNLLENKEEYIKIYNTSIEYFNNNYISKKNVRRVIRSFIRGSKIVQDEMYKNIIEKNIFNISYENVPYCVYINFDI